MYEVFTPNDERNFSSDDAMSSQGVSSKAVTYVTHCNLFQELHSIQCEMHQSELTPCDTSYKQEPSATTPTARFDVTGSLTGPAPSPAF